MIGWILVMVLACESNALQGPFIEEPGEVASYVDDTRCITIDIEDHADALP
jgi:hypothetical protein